MSAPWAIIPIKRFDRGKSRLGRALGTSERRALSQALFARVLGACISCAQRGVLERVLIATDAPAIARSVIAHPACRALLDEQPARPFARVIDRALAHAHAAGASRAVVLMADLPAITASDVAQLVAALDAHDVIVAPDRARRGVGAIGCRLPAPLSVHLGHSDSFLRHLVVLRADRVSVGVVSNPRIARDIDRREDLEP